MNNTLDLTKYTNEDFKRFSIFELRDIAAFFGVPSPTSHSKGELLAYINEAINNPKVLSVATQQETEAKKGKGRPTKPAQNNYIYLSTDARRNADQNAFSNPSIAEPSSVYGSINDFINQEPVDAVGIKIGAYEKLQKGEAHEYKGYLELNIKGYGFLRANPAIVDANKDAHVDYSVIKRFGLRNGDIINAIGIKAYEDKAATILHVISINGVETDDMQPRTTFESLTAVFPTERYILAKDGASQVSLRLLDMIAPLGKGQRTLITAPSQSGNTTLIMNIAESISSNYSDAEVYVLLIDTSPEEITEFNRNVKGHVFYTTFESSVEQQIAVAEQVLDSAKRQVESGRDAVIVVDNLGKLVQSCTQFEELNRAKLVGATDKENVNLPKAFFGAARNVEEGGSLTIIASINATQTTALYSDYKGVSNMQITLDENLAERRIFPAININKTFTKNEDKLMNSKEIKVASAIREQAFDGGIDFVKSVLTKLKYTANNVEFVNKYYS